MKARKVLMGLKWAVMGIAFVSLAALAVMGLWNWLLPSLVGVPAIGFLQAAGLLVLTRLLLGGFKRGGWHRHHHGHHHWKHRMAEKWEKMTPEEREQWKSQMNHWCHHRKCEPTPATGSEG